MKYYYSFNAKNGKSFIGGIAETRAWIYGSGEVLNMREVVIAHRDAGSFQCTDGDYAGIDFKFSEVENE